MWGCFEWMMKIENGLGIIFAGMGISDLHEIIAVLEDMIEEKEEELWVVKE
jgi:hypothetical protein